MAFDAFNCCRAETLPPIVATPTNVDVYVLGRRELFLLLLLLLLSLISDGLRRLMLKNVERLLQRRLGKNRLNRERERERERGMVC
jgi:hypothetical protein